MTSTFSWLDHSEAQRRQMLEVIDLFREKGTLDELGFGAIRDAFADHFFPGTSTLHTRARYLLFIPWIYQRIERDRVPYANLDQRARSDQARLAQALRRGGEGEAQGVIGIEAGATLQRPPSVIYSTALRKFRIWRFPGTVGQYYAAKERAGASARPLTSDDGELVEETTLRGWDPGLPTEPTGLFESTTFAMPVEEADYLYERIVTEAQGTLFAYVLEGSRRIARIDYPWQHPDLSQFPPALQQDLEHARRFSLVAYGAVLLYNLLLAERADEAGLPVGEGLVDRYRRDYGTWADRAATDRRSLANWNLDDLWATVVGKGHNITYPTREFTRSWVAVLSGGPEQAADDPGIRRAIELRELSLKGGLARLTHRRALERYSGSAGLFEQTYRWPNVRQIAQDIQRGLSRRGAGDAGNA